MREIKFRALVQEENSTNPYWIYYSTFEIPVNKDVKILVKDLQYTGIKDKNSKEIYEGDVLDVFEDEDEDFSVKDLYVVEWDSDMAGFLVSFLNTKEKIVNDFWPYLDTEINVVGNIFEDPYSLRSKEENKIN